MNSIRQIQELNKRELEAGVSPEASWHTDYRDTAYIFIGGLPFELSEGDVITIFSQFGEPTYINLIRDKETGKSRGFCYLKYEDQRSTDLAVDNLGGADIMGRKLKVDHTRYKKKDGEHETGMDLTVQAKELEEEERRRKRRKTDESESEEERPRLKEEIELAKLIQNHDEDDPMKQFLIEEKKEEVEKALARMKSGKKSGKSTHKHKHHHRSRREILPEDGERRSSQKREDRERRRSKSPDRDERGKERERPRRRSRSGDRPPRNDGDRPRRRSNSRDRQHGRQREYEPRRKENSRERHHRPRDS